jgi:hypothetical protein
VVVITHVLVQHNSFRPAHLLELGILRLDPRQLSRCRSIKLRGMNKDYVCMLNGARHVKGLSEAFTGMIPATAAD